MTHCFQNSEEELAAEEARSWSIYCAPQVILLFIFNGTRICETESWHKYPQ